MEVIWLVGSITGLFYLWYYREDLKHVSEDAKWQSLSMLIAFTVVASWALVFLLQYLHYEENEIRY